MANDGTKNLRPQNTRTKEEQREIARMGGKASGKARRERKAMADMMRDLLDITSRKGKATPSDKIKTKDDLKTANLTYEMEMFLGLINQARKGKVDAVDKVLDILGVSTQVTVISPLDALSKDIEKYKDMDDDEDGAD